jgi:SAM-dependent methyltransferase
MNKLPAFVKSFRWIFGFTIDLYRELFKIKNKNATTALILARSAAINNQLRRLASTGGTAFYAFHEFREVQALCIKHNLIPRKILEIGTGFNLGILSLFLMSSAEKAYGVDIEPMEERYDEYFYDTLKEYLKSAGGLHWYRFFMQNRPTPHLSFPSSLDHFDFKKLVSKIEYLAPCSSESIPLPENSMDLVYSVATFEHLPKTRETVVEIKRLLVNGGLTIHEIDMSYHRHHPNPLEMLRHSEEDWQVITNQYGEGLGVNDIEQGKFKSEIYCNRLRTSDFVSFFEESNFEILEIKPVVKFDPDHIDRSRINEKFSNKSLDDLSTTVVVIVARCRK